MSIDLSQFHQVFFEESFEGLDIMESSLMELDPEDIDDETINAIFRSAHSIKGGSATFGFTSISEFTHVLETLLDEIRAGKRGISGDDVNLFLRSVDCMKEMLQLIQAGEEGVTPLSIELKEVFSSILEAGDAHAESKSSPETDTNASDIDDVATQEVRWKIHFVPGKDILKTGNEPIRLFMELAELGDLTCHTHTDKLPDLQGLLPEDCCFYWDIELVANVEKYLIEEVFEWVEDESEIIITEERVLGVDDGKNAWEITFKPEPHVLRTGNDPYKIISSLELLGSVSVTADISRMPSLSGLEPENCYLDWVIVLKGNDIQEQSIREVFEWVEDDCELHLEKIAHQEGGAATQNAVTDHQPEIIKPEIRVDDSQSQKIQETEKASVTPIHAGKDKSGEKADVETQKQTASKAKPQVKKKSVESSSIRVGIDKVDSLINMVGELVITQSMLGQLGTDFNLENVPKLLEGLGQLEQNTRELQESVMRIRMLPISFAFSRFPRMVRDLSQSLGKSIELEMLGEQTELDKTVMEKIGDPLVHLVRNAVDHGIEPPEEREKKNKYPAGRIILNAFHQGGNVVIEIEDDGRGLDPQKLKDKAVSNGILSSSEAEILTKEQAYDLIFQPGFSTAKQVTDVSGRGVGMDVVKKNILALNGSIEISSELGFGSKITIRLPLTLAILDGQLVRVGDSTYIFPLISIVESIQCKKELVSRVAGGCDVFKLRDDYVPIINLAQAFSIDVGTKSTEQSLMVVVESEGDKVAIVVDELLAQQQVVIKSLEQNYHKVNGISGATILGNGTVALIIDIPGVVKLAGAEFKATQSKIQATLAAMEQKVAVN